MGACPPPARAVLGATATAILEARSDCPLLGCMAKSVKVCLLEYDRQKRVDWCRCFAPRSDGFAGPSSELAKQTCARHDLGRFLAGPAVVEILTLDVNNAMLYH